MEAKRTPAINLDFAAATPVCQSALSAMMPYFSEKYYNPSAPYWPAKEVRDEYEAAKARLAQSIGAKAADLVVCSGATEANNLAFTLVPEGTRVLILSTEHDAVRAPAGQCDFEEIKVDKNGVILLEDFRAKLSDRVSLVSISLANNEIGTIQPMAEIAEIIREERLKRAKIGNNLPIFLHSDASQALTLIDVSVARLGVDMMTLNSAKIYGPKGVGALFATPEAMKKLKPVVRGGGQENNLRSGTENVPLLIGFATAAVEAKEHLFSARKKYAELTTLLAQKLAENRIAPQFLGNNKTRLVNFLPISYPGLDAERLIYKLEENGVLISTGAACAARKGEKSRTLTAIGLSDKEIAGSLRISLGATNTKEEILRAAELINAAVNEEHERIYG
ncbi:cysteine desulfurase [Candidatus Saccharibacteria bacterium]|nr:cysteine desulfurase [Candidatus Saccharibacteria bacterium]